MKSRCPVRISDLNFAFVQDFEFEFGSRPLFRVVPKSLFCRLHFLPFLPIVVIGFIVGQSYRWSQICCHEPEQSEVD